MVHLIECGKRGKITIPGKDCADQLQNNEEVWICGFCEVEYDDESGDRYVR